METSDNCSGALLVFCSLNKREYEEAESTPFAEKLSKNLNDIGYNATVYVFASCAAVASQRSHELNRVINRVKNGRFKEVWLFGSDLSSPVFEILKVAPETTELGNCSKDYSTLDTYLRLFEKGTVTLGHTKTVGNHSA